MGYTKKGHLALRISSGEFLKYIDLSGVDPNTPVYKPGEIASCTITEYTTGPLKKHQLAAHIKYADPRFCSCIDYWNLDNMNKWID